MRAMRVNGGLDLSAGASEIAFDKTVHKDCQIRYPFTGFVDKGREGFFQLRVSSLLLDLGGFQLLMALGNSVQAVRDSLQRRFDAFESFFRRHPSTIEYIVECRSTTDNKNFFGFE